MSTFIDISFGVTNTRHSFLLLLLQLIPDHLRPPTVVSGKKLRARLFVTLLQPSRQLEAPRLFSVQIPRF